MKVLNGLDILLTYQDPPRGVWWGVYIFIAPKLRLGEVVEKGSTYTV